MKANEQGIEHRIHMIKVGNKAGKGLSLEHNNHQQKFKEHHAKTKARMLIVKEHHVKNRARMRARMLHKDDTGETKAPAFEHNIGQPKAPTGVRASAIKHNVGHIPAPAVIPAPTIAKAKEAVPPMDRNDSGSFDIKHTMTMLESQSPVLLLGVGIALLFCMSCMVWFACRQAQAHKGAPKNPYGTKYPLLRSEEYRD